MYVLVVLDVENLHEVRHEIHEALQQISDAWWNHLPGVWILQTNLPADEVWDRIADFVQVTDAGLALPFAFTDVAEGLLSASAWDWLNTRTP